MELKAVQQPLKQRYREDPEKALVTVRAQSRVGAGYTAVVETAYGPTVVAGLHPSAGGDGSAACSGDMLLEALVACAGVTLAAVATSMGIELKDATITAEGDFDARGTLGVSKEVPVGLQNVRMTFSLDTDADEEKRAALLRLTERYCVVLQTLRHPPTFVLAPA